MTSPESDTLRSALREHQTSFESLSEWMRSPESTTMVQEWMASVPEIDTLSPPLKFPEDSKVFLTLVMMHQEADTIFTASPVDRVMRDVTTGWRKRLDGAFEHGEFEAFVRETGKARRVFSAWRSQDREKVVQYLTDKIVLMRAMRPQPAAEEFETVLGEIRSIISSKNELIVFGTP